SSVRIATSSSRSSRPSRASGPTAWGRQLIPTPSSRISVLRSKISHSIPASCRNRAVVSPPMPAPAISTFTRRDASATVRSAEPAGTAEKPTNAPRDLAGYRRCRRALPPGGARGTAGAAPSPLRGPAHPALPVRRARQPHREPRGGVAPGRRELRAGEEERVAQVGAREVGPAQVRAQQVGLTQVRAAQVGADEQRAAEARPAQVGAPQPGAQELGPAPVRAPARRPREV